MPSMPEVLTVEDVLNPPCWDCGYPLWLRQWFFGYREVWWCEDCGTVKLVGEAPKS